MKIEFTKEEMEKLLEVLSIADWVLTSNDVEDDERKDPYVNLLKRIYAEAYKNGMTDQIEYDENCQDYFPKDEWEENAQAQDFIEEYDDATFWEELVYRLSDRDMEREMNGKVPTNVKAQIEMFTRVQTKYEEEFERNNLDNLQIVKKEKKPAAKKTSEKKSAPKKN